MKISSIHRLSVVRQSIVDGKLVTEFSRYLFDDGSEMNPAGTIVCEQPTQEDHDRYRDEGLEEFGGILSDTVTRLGVMFWDEGHFTPRSQESNTELAEFSVPINPLTDDELHAASLLIVRNASSVYCDDPGVYPTFDMFLGFRLGVDSIQFVPQNGGRKEMDRLAKAVISAANAERLLTDPRSP